MKLIELEREPFLEDYTYGGASGLKKAIEYDGAVWMLKFPKSTREFNKAGVSYTTSPLNEYLGSHVYASLGIPVHDTLLGVKSGRIVVGCKDFVTDQGRLIDFLNIKNSIIPDGDDFYDFETSGNGTNLNSVLYAIERGMQGSWFATVPDVKKRFWDMFVVDAFIRNTDRNNGNWGVLKKKDGTIELAPVYDNGNAFFSTRRGSQNARRATDDQMLFDDAFGGYRSIFEYDDGHRIEPYEFMARHEYPECDAAVLRFIERCDMGRIEALIDDVPEQWNEKSIMPQGTKDLYKAILNIHYDTIVAISEGRELTKELKRDLVRGRGEASLQDVLSAQESSKVLQDSRGDLPLSHADPVL